MAEEHEGYSSEQCKYRLFKMLQRTFSMDKEKERYYTRDFFQKLLLGIEMTEEAYWNFVEVLEKEMAYCSKKGIHDSEGCDSQQVVDDLSGDLIAAFEKINITLVLDYHASSYCDFIFTKPDGSVMTYRSSDGGNEFYINANCGQEISYAKLASQDYLLYPMEPKSLSDDNYQMAAKDVYWEYDADTATMTITGTGIYYGVTKEEQMGSGAYTTLIFGADIAELNYAEATNSASLTKVVLLHPADFPLVITKFDYSGANDYVNTARTWDVYTDNEVFKNFAWNKKLTINWHTLDEWEG